MQNKKSEYQRLYIQTIQLFSSLFNILLKTVTAMAVDRDDTGAEINGEILDDLCSAQFAGEVISCHSMYLIYWLTEVDDDFNQQGNPYKFVQN